MQTMIQARLFLVGCPRSGTTLLQSMIAAHSEITSFPESHFFENLATSRRRWKPLQNAGFVTPNAVAKFNLFLERIEQKKMRDRLPPLAVLSRQYAFGFINVLDAIAAERGKSIWLEKTPQHINCIDYIEDLKVGAKFIHIIRNGTDVVASQYDAACKNTSTSWQAHQNLDKCIRSWTKDVSLSLNQLHKPNHFIVRYEQLIEQPEEALNQVCQFIGIPFESVMLQNYASASEKLVLKHELSWKSSVSQPIYNANGKKFYELFTDEQRQYILEQLSAVSQRVSEAELGNSAIT